jgi:general secretion pathway protein C
MKFELNELKPSGSILRIVLWGANGIAAAILVAGSINLILSFYTPLYPPENAVSVAKASRTPSPSQYPNSDELALVQRNNPSNNTSDTPSNNSLEGVDTEGVKKIEESKLPLEVVGITFGPPGFRAVTLRNLENRTVRTLTVGDVWNQAQIEGINRSEIILLNRKTDRAEVLPLNRSAGVESTDSSDESKNVQSVSRYEVNEAIQSNMNKLLTEVEVKPAFRNGDIAGFTMKSLEGRPGELLKKLGFQGGDVITRVNGEKIDSMDQALKLWTSLRHQKNFNIQILRNGEQKSLEYQLTR